MLTFLRRLVPPRGFAADILLHLIALVGLFALALRLLDNVTAGLACLAVVLAHVIWNLLSAKRIDHPGAGGWSEFALAAAFSFLALVLFAVLLLDGPLGLLLCLAALGAIVVPALLARRFASTRLAWPRGRVVWALVVAGLPLVAASLASFALVAFRAADIGALGALLRRRRRDWLGGGFGQIAIAVPGGLALVGTASGMASLGGVRGVAASMNLPWAHDNYAALRATCRAHLTGERETVTWLISSHASTRAGWAGTVTSNILTEHIQGAGGFCTQAGALADAYQG